MARLELRRRPSARFQDPRTVVEAVGERIRILRAGQSGSGVTQQTIARQAGISVSYMSMIERGERSPSVETLALIAQALRVRVDELFQEGAILADQPNTARATASNRSRSRRPRSFPRT